MRCKTFPKPRISKEKIYDHRKTFFLFVEAQQNLDEGSESFESYKMVQRDLQQREKVHQSTLSGNNVNKPRLQG